MTAIKMTVDEALVLTDEWTDGATVHPDSRGPATMCLVLAEEVRRLQSSQRAMAALADERSRETFEARADERTAMGYLAQVRQAVGGEDFPDMVRRVEAMAKAAP